MKTRAAFTIAIMILAGVLMAPTVGDQYGAAAWRILKTMIGSSTCAPGSYCMWGGGVYYADSVAEAQAALDNGCGADVTGTSPTGCRVVLSGGVLGNGGTTLHLAGTGSSATGRSGVTLQCTGGGTTQDAAGDPISGTVIKSEGAVPIIDIGVCQGCLIQDCTLAGEDTATVGIDILSPTGSDPTTRLVIRNVAMYEINGYGIRTGTTGQVDTMLFENVSVRDSDGCYQQRDTQTLGAILTNFDCSTATSTDPLFDIAEGDFTLLNSFVGLKNNGVGVRLGKPAAKTIIRGNQLELGTSSSAMLFDFDEGSSVTESNILVEGNHVVFSESGNTLFDVQRKGTLVIMGNSWQDTAGGKTITSDLMVDNSNALNRLYVTLIGNQEAHNGSGGVERPVRWIPTLTPNATHGVYPTLLTLVLSNPDPTKVTACIDGELLNDSDAAAGSNSVQKCLGGAWVAL